MAQGILVVALGYIDRGVRYFGFGAVFFGFGNGILVTAYFCHCTGHFLS